ncbi:MAG: archaeal flagellin [halophilic archaeon J07HB67]|jgi:archaeal flagellin N-terminal-like domain|nr:MAG: archaeal flagellin [halophilic archaeon J07HB67]
MGHTTPGERGERRRAQAGVGTLILLIALLLIAAIAAGVFLNVSQVFQGQSEETGEAVRERLTGEVSVVATTGNVTTVDGTTGVDRVRFILTTGGAGQRIAIDETLVVWAGPDGSYQLTAAADPDDPASIDGSEFAYVVERDGDGSAPILNARSDRVAVVVSVGSFGTDAVVEPGDAVSVTFVTPDGSQTVARIAVPQSVPGRDSVVL